MVASRKTRTCGVKAWKSGCRSWSRTWGLRSVVCRRQPLLRLRPLRLLPRPQPKLWGRPQTRVWVRRRKQHLRPSWARPRWLLHRRWQHHPRRHPPLSRLLPKFHAVVCLRPNPRPRAPTTPPRRSPSRSRVRLRRRAPPRKPAVRQVQLRLLVVCLVHLRRHLRPRLQQAKPLLRVRTR